MKFEKWLDIFIDEKGFDLEYRVELDGQSGVNSIPLGCVVDAMKKAPKDEQNSIKTTLVKIDFANGDCLDYFRHLAQALSV